MHFGVDSRGWKCNCLKRSVLWSRNQGRYVDSGQRGEGEKKMVQSRTRHLRERDEGDAANGGRRRRGDKGEGEGEDTRLLACCADSRILYRPNPKKRNESHVPLGVGPSGRRGYFGKIFTEKSVGRVMGIPDIEG
eukprot:767828-Hanusia_phi.AAC.4